MNSEEEKIAAHKAVLKERRRLRSKREYLRRKSQGKIKPRSPEKYAAYRLQQDTKRSSMSEEEKSINREKIRQATVRYRNRLAEEKAAEIRRINKEKIKYKRDTDLEFREVCKRRCREYLKRNPHLQVKYNVKRRMRVENDTTQEERDAADKYIRKIKRIKVHYCVYCNKEITNKEIHIDHIIPLSRGGRHVKDNLAVACAFCNVSKGAKLLHTEWVPPNAKKLP